MSKITNSYTSKSGMIYNLYQFDTTKIYSPAEKREIENNNFDYYAAIQNDRVDEKIKELALKTKIPSKEEQEEIWYQEKLQEDKEKKLAFLLVSQQQQAFEKQKQDYLNDSSLLEIEICEPTFYDFLKKYEIRLKQKYVVDGSSLSVMGVGLFHCRMHKTQAAPAAK
ncbi:hypothetical protein H8K32_02445 [Undibacterium jejuense]|uniref:Uncharacterized protein n=1 Tax=Undibacterium jejuense TaxID=1344949 RepID=A0A923HJQ7_9BURK|nr:hypothetical protein [Undibacterium jejuense]MBC3860946.1 hypothetical protein [Undibacterium jejuense]